MHVTSLQVSSFTVLARVFQHNYTQVYNTWWRKFQGTASRAGHIAADSLEVGYFELGTLTSVEDQVGCPLIIRTECNSMWNQQGTLHSADNELDNDTSAFNTENTDK